MLLLGFLVLDEDALYECSNYVEPREDKEPGPRPAVLDRLSELAPQTSEPPRSVSTSVPAVERAEGSSDMRLEKGAHWPFHALDLAQSVLVDPKTKEITAVSVPKLIERLTHHVTPGTHFPLIAVFYLSSIPLSPLHPFH